MSIQVHFEYLKPFTALGCQMEQSPKVKNNDSDKITDTGGVELYYPIEKIYIAIMLKLCGDKGFNYVAFMQFHCNGEILLFIFSLQFSTGFRGTSIHCVTALSLISCLVKLFSKLSCTQVQDVILKNFF